MGERVPIKSVFGFRTNLGTSNNWKFLGLPDFHLMCRRFLFLSKSGALMRSSPMDFGWCCSYNLPKKNIIHIHIYIYIQCSYIFFNIFYSLNFFLMICVLASFHPTRARCLVARGASSVSGPEFFPVGRGAVESETS